MSLLRSRALWASPPRCHGKDPDAPHGAPGFFPTGSRGRERHLDNIPPQHVPRMKQLDLCSWAAMGYPVPGRVYASDEVRHWKEGSPKR